MVVVLAVILGAGALGATWLRSAYLSDIPAIPERDALWAVRRSPGMTFLDHDGGLIATRGARYGARVTLAELPAYVPRAFLAAEDRRFYQPRAGRPARHRPRRRSADFAPAAPSRAARP